MRTISIISLLLLISITIYGQGEQDLSDLNNKTWYAGPNFEPGIIALVEQPAVMSFVFLSGIRVGKKISEKLSIESGITYYNAKLDLGGRWTTQTYYYYSTIKYIEVPVGVKFNLNNNKQKVNPYLLAGVVSSFSLKSKLERTNEQYELKVFENNNFKYQHSYLNINFGTEFYLSENLLFYLGTDIRFSLLQILIKDDPFPNHNILTGINTGVNYKF